MTTKRKAELQRRLSMASVPKPPAGLADRIKADIPDLLSTTRERERLSSSIAFNVRVAASIILLVSSAYLCVQLLSRASRNDAAAPPMLRMAVKTAPATLPVRRAEEAPTAAQQVQPVSAQEPRTERVERVERAEPITDRPITERMNERPAPAAAAAPAPAPPPAAPAPAPVLYGRDQTITITAEAPLIDVPHAASESAPAAPAAKTLSGVVGGVIGGVTGDSGDFVRSARAADIVQPSRDELFGISVDGHAFANVKSSIERGERPQSVNVEALINYFAGPPDHRAPREVGLEVEASPAPVSAGPRVFIIRMTIDTARQDVPPSSSALPVATDARLEIDLDRDAVVSHRLAGSGDELSAAEPTLLKNSSVTGLYEVELRSNLPWRQPIATVRLHYRSVATGKEKTITRIVHASDVARPWVEASRRHRLASLGAIWGETLKNAPDALREATKATDVARRAEELANQEPRDAKARELAMLASASSRLQSSGPTGSGR
jgi:hypothetical protein